MRCSGRAAPAELPGTLMLNPPYGERIEAERQRQRAGAPARRGRRDTPGTTSSPAGRALEARYTTSAGWTAWVLSPDMKLPGAMRLKESRARADVERADRMPAVPLRPGGRVDALVARMQVPGSRRSAAGHPADQLAHVAEPARPALRPLGVSWSTT